MRVYRVAVSSAALVVASILVVGCSRGSSLPTQSGGQHQLSVSAGIYNANLLTSSGVILEVQLLVDGASVADQKFASGSDVADFNYTATYSSAGSHQVSIRVVKQRDALDVYGMTGAVVGIFGAASTSAEFPSSSQSLGAGGEITVSVNIP